MNSMIPDKMSAPLQPAAIVRFLFKILFFSSRAASSPYSGTLLADIEVKKQMKTAPMVMGTEIVRPKRACASVTGIVVCAMQI